MWTDDCFRVLPFRFLDRESRAWLTPRLTPHTHEAGETLFSQGDTSDDRVYLLLSGTVELLDRGRRRGLVDAGHYFGERSALLDIPRVYDAVALTDARTATLPGEDLRALLRRSPVLAQQLGWLLRDKQGLFHAFHRFVAEVRHGASRGHIVIPRLLHLYKPLQPALHAHASDDGLDLEALTYAVHRLPTNLQRTLTWFVTDDLPLLYSRPDEVFTPVPTAARRRAVYEMMPGKNLVLLRDGLSDLVDLVCCLCIYAVEARKLRRRLNDPGLLLELAGGGTPPLPLSETEEAVLRRLWPDLEARLAQIAVHHEDFAVDVYKRLNSYDSGHAERWTRQIADAVHTLLGLEPHLLPDDFEVHVVSSNTHSVGNCLSTWLVEHAPEIEAWGRQHHPELAELPWHDPRDRIVALARPYLAAFPDIALQRRLSEACEGVLRLDDTAFTGIEVQLFDLARLADRALPLQVQAPGRPGLLVNIDYAFGQQAEAIMGALVALFGPRLRSVNILGKAGGLLGRRGDVLVATSFVEQEDDALHVPRTRLDLDRLAARCPDRAIHVGPVLTVLGTVLQNRDLLHFYQHIWGAVGLEMEGSYYCRQILESQQLGVVREDVDLRFLYYVSDLPLQAGATLSGPLKAAEGIPPLYAVTREVLTSILEPR